MPASDGESEYEDEVFEFITDPVENVQDYVPGGLHPVRFGESVCDDRYRIIRKLGYGAYSTVWLAQDTSKDDTFVAIKISRADRSHAREVEIHDALRAEANRDPKSSSVVMLKDYFVLHGPNGGHECLIYDPMGPSITQIRDDDHPGFNQVAYLTLSAVRKISYQVLLGLHYMHSVGVVHGDLYAANVLLAIEDISHKPLETLCQSHDDISRMVRRKNGPLQAGDPRHLTLNRPLSEFTSSKVEVKISDLGSSFFETNPPDEVEMPAEIRSPEVLLGGPFSMRQDCWAFGCLVCNMLTNGYPFDLAFIYDDEALNDTHLIQLFALLGPLPAELRNKWPGYRQYFNDQGELVNFEVDDGWDAEDTFPDAGPEKVPGRDGQRGTESSTLNADHDEKVNDFPQTTSTTHSEKPEGRSKPHPFPTIIKRFERPPDVHHKDPTSPSEYLALFPPLRKKLLMKKHPDMGSEEFEALLSLLQGLFAYDPDKRLSTEDILQHAWIRDYCAPACESGNAFEEQTTGTAKKRRRSSSDESALLGRKKSVTSDAIAPE